MMIRLLMKSDHDLQLKQRLNENSIPKSVVKLEDLYDIKDRFKKVTNAKLQSSTLRFELVNLGTEAKPQNVNLGLELTSEERFSFIRLLNKYKNVFAWNYEDLKTYDTSIIQHTIPMISDEKPVQQKLRKIHPNLESQIKAELNKLLES
jgi:Mg2+ and Co2+ transporter CorA